jgi:predicted nucleic acid-binding protein
MSQAEAWQVYDRWLDDPRIVFLDEPQGLELTLRRYSRLKQPAPKDWADAYVLAFALVSGMRLVTFDQAFRDKTDDLVLLGT